MFDQCDLTDDGLRTFARLVGRNDRHGRIVAERIARLQRPQQTRDVEAEETRVRFCGLRATACCIVEIQRADVIDFDVIYPRTIQIREIWASAPHGKWQLYIPSQSDTLIEVGIFGEGTGEDKDEYALTGVRAILGEYKNFEPTSFTFPHRHHIHHSNKLNSSLSPPYGSHPTLQTTLPKSALQPPLNNTLDYETCNLHALFTLSKEVFVDKYQLAQLAQFQSGGIKHLRGVWGETDLEDPSYKTKGWGSVVLIDISPTEEELTLKLPLHLRYLDPLEGGGNRHLDILPPEVFWACANTVEGIVSSY